MNFQIYSLFPKPIGIFKLDKPVTKTEKDFILSLERRPNQGNMTSADHYLLEHKKMNRLKKFFENSVETFLKNVYVPINPLSLRITQCWANYSEKGQWHHAHAHPNSFISGVFYLQSDLATDRIYFLKAEYKQLEIPTETFNQFNSDDWWFEAEENTLLLFPSGTTHRVDAVQVDQTRVSISFNTFPCGILGHDKTLTECKL